MRNKRLITIIAAVSLLLTGCGETVAESIAKNPKQEKSEQEIIKETEETVTEAVEQTQETESDSSYDFTVCFAGDISLAEDAVTTASLEASENGIYGCISKELIDIMQSADIMCLNNEFAYSTRGSAMEGKAYTFRANPSRVEVLKELGVDVVSLANNHVYDYGKDAMLDTLDTLADAQIEYFGAGKNLQEALQPVYFELGGKKVAFVGASRAEKYKLTPQATEDSPGILRCYDTELFMNEIKEADENADIVIAYVHWGTEYSYELEEAQLTTARAYIDAGADVIMGAHSHCLQGMEYYNGKPIIYSMGNYWFNSKTLDTMLIKLHFTGDNLQDNLEVSVVPAVQTEAKTIYASDPNEQKRIYDFISSISVNVVIDNEGIVYEEQ